MRDRQQAPALLAQRVLPGQGAGRQRGRGRVAGVECGGGELLARAEPQLLEPGGLGLCPRLVCELRERRSTPAAERAFEHRAAVKGVRRRRRIAQVRLEPAGVDLVVGEPQRVSGRLADQQGRGGARCPVRFEQAAQVGDVSLQRTERSGRGFAVPEVVDQTVDRDHLAVRDQQQGQHRALARTTEIHGGVVDGDRRRAEHAQVQHDPSA